MEKQRSKSVEETLEIAENYSKTVKPGDVICLKGDLGAGKTHFVKGFVRGFGIPQSEVSSPTFTIINEYHGELSVYHFDCYRLEDPGEALEIGAEEYFYGEGVCIVEWPERILNILPAEVKNITIKTISENEREFTFQ